MGRTTRKIETLIFLLVLVIAALAAVLGFQISMLAEKVLDLGFHRLGKKGTCAKLL